MDVGLVGLGTMGGRMAVRLRDAGHGVIGHDLRPEAREHVRAEDIEVVDTLRQLTDALPAPRIVWLMLPAGDTTSAVIDALVGLLDPGDLVVDGGNSDFRSAPDRAASLSQQGVSFVDAGVSGGQWGWKDGYGITAGGSKADVTRLEPILQALAAPGAYARVGGVGAGHLAKAVHNGVEYGVMQAYAEGFALLSAHDDVDVVTAVQVWQRGCSIRSWLLEQTLAALEGNPALDGITHRVDDSGMGRWTTQEAVRLGVPTPVLTAALHARFTSRDDDRRAQRLLAAARRQIGGHAAHA
jgi:6-phosphogluconate dehydrogenase